MKYLFLILLFGCAKTPEKKPLPKPTCLTVDELELSAENVKDLTSRLAEEDHKLTVVTRKNQILTTKFNRLTEAFESASPQSLPKLQEKKDQLILEAKENEKEGKTIQRQIERLKEQIKTQLNLVSTSIETCP